MKRIILSLALFASGLSLFSQMNTGSYFISGSIPLDLELYSTNEVDNPDLKTTNQYINFSPKGGYFIKNRLAVGGIVDYSMTRNKQEYGTGEVYRNKYTQVLVGPLGRFYYEYGTMMPFAEAFLGLGRSSTLYAYDLGGGETTETKTSHSVFKLALGGGANYFLNDAIAFEGLLQYFWETQKPTSGTGGGHRYSGIMLLVGVSIYFGSI